MLRLEQVELRAGDFTLHADWAVAPGTKLAVIGPSGAGKTTLIEAIAGFRNLSGGRILWDGQDISRAAPGARPVAMLFQDGNLFPHLSVAQNAGLGLRPDLRLSPDQRAQVVAALERVGLAGLADRKPGALSGGQQSRAALARVLLQDKPLLLLDEPFAALGPALKAEMLDLVAELAAEKGATLMMITHDPEDARRIAGQTIVVAEGRAASPQPTVEVLDKPPPALQEYLASSA